METRGRVYPSQLWGENNQVLGLVLRRVLGGFISGVGEPVWGLMLSYVLVITRVTEIASVSHKGGKGLY